MMPLGVIEVSITQYEKMEESQYIGLYGRLCKFSRFLKMRFVGFPHNFKVMSVGYTLEIMTNTGLYLIANCWTLSIRT